MFCAEPGLSNPHSSLATLSRGFLSPGRTILQTMSICQFLLRLRSSSSTSAGEYQDLPPTTPSPALPFSTGTAVKAVARAVHLFFSGAWWTLMLPPRHCMPLLSRGIVSDTKLFHQNHWPLWIVTRACVLRVAQSCPALWTAARQAPLIMGFSRQEYWSGLPCSPPGDLPNPEIEPESPVSPALAGRFLTTKTPGEAPRKYSSSN